MQLGIVVPQRNRLSYSSAEQLFSIPAGAKATLTFWHRMPDSGGRGDFAYFMIRTTGGSWRTLRIIQRNVPEWTRLSVDVSHYAGRSFRLRVGVRNDGPADGRAAAMYVDDVSLQACTR
jgi:hypothetical protein